MRNMVEKQGRVIRIGTRKSRLAMAQTMLAARALEEAEPGLKAEIVPLTTKGDRILDRSLVEFGGKGAFVAEFEQALLEGKIDAAVHSAKDMPMELAGGLFVSAVLEREDPRDVFVTVKGRSIQNSPMIVGTGSLRRQIQIKERKNCICKLLRGNVNTRLEKLCEGQYDGILLAAAGLLRLGLLKDERFSFEFLPETEFIPAGGQAIIAIEAREDSEFNGLFQKINHIPTEYSLRAEREVLRLLGAGCNEAIGVYSFIEGESLFMKLMREQMGKTVRCAAEGEPQEYRALARKLVKSL